jgi:16S rRNA (adenine1518-N6/adenine1519-N6)-dimethyltransferase
MLLRPKKKLSQNFLSDPSILERIVDTSGLGPEETVVEIGPGPGTLTRMLATRAGRVIAIEIDRDLYAERAREFAGHQRVTVVEGDALKYPFESIEGRFRVVANIPYHITTPIMFRLLDHREKLLSMTLTVQKELARRVVAGPGTKDYGVLSVMVQYHGVASYAFTIPRGAFWPRPKVDSACLHVDVTPEPTVGVGSHSGLKRVVRAAFSQRRKTLRNSLGVLVDDAAGLLEFLGIDPGRRAETLSIEDFARIADAVGQAEQG